jgi:hypothetical protein
LATLKKVTFLQRKAQYAANHSTGPQQGISSMKRATLLSLAFMSFSLVAFAGKEEREYLKSDLTPAVDTAAATLEKSCGCKIKITVNANTIKTKDDMGKARYIAADISENAAKYCNDDDSKKAVCQMKTLEISKAKEATFSFKAGKGVATHDGQMHTTWDMITRELDK